MLRIPNGEFSKFRLRSVVGLIPLFAIEVLDREDLDPHPEFCGNVEWSIKNRPDLVGQACYSVDGCRYVLAIADAPQFAPLLQYICDAEEFLSAYGLRSLSKYHEQHPFCFAGRRVAYEAGESNTMIKGGNSNWRGPIWLPTNYLLIRSLLKFGHALGPGLAVKGRSSGDPIQPYEAAREIAERLIALFKRDGYGRRLCFGPYRKFQEDPHWRHYLLFHEYYHGDTGQGVGASHQTGWSVLVANLIDEWRR